MKSEMNLNILINDRQIEVINGAVALQDNHVVFGGCDAWLRIINCQSGISTDSLLLDGSINWKYMLKGNTGESSPVVCKEKILVCTKTGIITIHDAKTGQPEWEYDTGEQITASPAVVDGHFMILNAKGTLFCFGNKKK